MRLTLSQIADMTGARLSKASDTKITGVAPFNEAATCDLTFAGDPKFLARLDQTQAGAVFVPDSFVPDPEQPPGSPVLLFTANPKLSFYKIVEHLFPQAPVQEGIHPSAVIGENTCLGHNISIQAHVVIGRNVSIGNNVQIMANAVISDDAVIGDNTVIKPNVTLMEKTRLGKEVIIHSNAVIGSDGFGFTQDGTGHTKQIHTGFVQIGDRVEIGACTTIDRGTLGKTVIGNGVKIDNQVHIAHNVKIGDNTLIVAQVGIAGSTQIGNGVILAGKAGVSGHLTIGDHVIVGPYAGVSSNVPANEIVSGAPHMPHKTWLRAINIIPRLPGIRQKLLALEKKLSQLESKI